MPNHNTKNNKSVKPVFLKGLVVSACLALSGEAQALNQKAQATNNNNKKQGKSMKKLLLGLFVVALIAADINYSLAHAEVVPETQETDSARYASLDTNGWFINLDEEPEAIWVLIAQSEGEK